MDERRYTAFLEVQPCSDLPAGAVLTTISAVPTPVLWDRLARATAELPADASLRIDLVPDA